MPPVFGPWSDEAEAVVGGSAVGPWSDEVTAYVGGPTDAFATVLSGGLAVLVPVYAHTARVDMTLAPVSTRAPGGSSPGTDPVPFDVDVMLTPLDTYAQMQAAVDAAPLDARIGIEGGWYPEWPGLTLRADPTMALQQTFVGDPNTRVYLDGSLDMGTTGWTSVGGGKWTKTVPGAAPLRTTTTNPGSVSATQVHYDPYFGDTAATLPEELLGRQGTAGDNKGWAALRRVATVGEVDAAGRWHVNQSTRLLTMQADPATYDELRLSIYRHAFASTWAPATIQDVEVRFFASHLRESAIGGGESPGPGGGRHRHWTLTRVASFFCHGAGFNIGPGDTHTLCQELYSGKTGVMGFGSELYGDPAGYIAPVVLDRSEYGYSFRLPGIDWGSEAGGSKLQALRAAGCVIRQCWWHHFAGPGLWLDVDNTGPGILVESTLIESGEHSGLFIEIAGGQYGGQADGSILARWLTIRRIGVGDVAGNGLGYSPADSTGEAVNVSNSRRVTLQACRLSENLRHLDVHGENRDPLLAAFHALDNHVDLSSYDDYGWALQRFSDAFNDGRVTDCGSDRNRFYGGTGSPFRYKGEALGWVGWRARRTGSGRTGALDPNGQYLSMPSTGMPDPAGFVPFVQETRYGPRAAV